MGTKCVSNDRCLCSHGLCISSLLYVFSDVTLGPAQINRPHTTMWKLKNFSSKLCIVAVSYTTPTRQKQNKLWIENKSKPIICTCFWKYATAKLYHNIQQWRQLYQVNNVTLRKQTMVYNFMKWRFRACLDQQRRPWWQWHPSPRCVYAHMM